MNISKIKERIKKIKEFVETIFYYNAKCTSSFPITTIIFVIVFLIFGSYSILLELYHRVKSMPEEQIQFIDTTYQPLNKVKNVSIEEIINYNELVSIARNKNNHQVNLNENLSNIYSNQIKKIKDKSLKELDRTKLGKFTSIVEHVTIDTENIHEEYQLGRSQGVINKNTIFQTWKIQDLLETTNIEIPEKYLIKPNNNTNNMIPIPNKKTFNLNDICIKNDQQKCIVHSPQFLWNYDISKFENDNNILDTISSSIHYGEKSSSISLFSIFGGIKFNSRGRLDSASSLILTFFLESKTIPNTTLTTIQAWNLLYRQVLENSIKKEYKDINIKQYKVTDISKELSYSTQDTDIFPSEYIVLLIIYLSLYFYIAFSIGKVQFIKSKYRLSFVAVISISFSLISSMGFLEFLSGINSSMFYPWSVFPYLILIIGTENIMAIVKSVVDTSIELPFSERYALGIKNVTWDLLGPLLINTLIMCCSAFSSHGPIMEFCFYSLICNIANFGLQICLFGPFFIFRYKKIRII